MQHITVLLQEAVEGLHLSPHSTVVDATLGSGGHGREIIKKLDRSGTYIGIDADPTALKAVELDHKQTNIILINDNFKNISQILSSLKIVKVDAILADLGWRMEQFSAGEKGLSFMVDEPLLMTYGGPEQYLFTAYDLVNEWEETSIADVIFGYGEDRYSRRIAKAIVDRRKQSPIKTTFELVDCVRSAVPGGYRSQKINPATKTFQAIRIAVNDELTVLKDFIKASFELLDNDGRLAIITFHSLEDRIVKQAFKALAAQEQGFLITKKPITATQEELKANPRSRSAKLRIISKSI